MPLGIGQGHNVGVKDFGYHVAQDILPDFGFVAAEAFYFHQHVLFSVCI